MRDGQPVVAGAFRAAALSLLCAGLLQAPPGARAQAADDECGGVRVPGQIQVEGKTLVRNGMGIRRATLLKVHVYVAALYVEQRSRRPAQLLGADQLKALTLHFVRDVDRDEMVDALEKGVRENARERQASTEQHMKQLARMLPALREGDNLTFRHVPGRGLSVYDEQRLAGTIEDDAFATLMFRIWLGPKPPDDGLKAGLLGGECD